MSNNVAPVLLSNERHTRTQGLFLFDVVLVWLLGQSRLRLLLWWIPLLDRVPSKRACCRAPPLFFWTSVARFPPIQTAVCPCDRVLSTDLIGTRLFLRILLRIVGSILLTLGTVWFSFYTGKLRTASIFFGFGRIFPFPAMWPRKLASRCKNWHLLGSIVRLASSSLFISRLNFRPRHVSQDFCEWAFFPGFKLFYV